MARSRIGQNQARDEDFLSEDEYADSVTTLSGHLQNQLDNHNHTEYITINGSRAFTSTVSGIDPTESSHIATKGYVDTHASSSSEWTLITSNYTANSGDNLFIDSSVSGSFTVLLPSDPSQGDKISFIDTSGSCGTYTVTLSGNGLLIMSPGPYVAPYGGSVSLNFGMNYTTSSGNDVDFNLNDDIRYFIDEDSAHFSLIYSVSAYGWRLF